MYILTDLRRLKLPVVLFGSFMVVGFVPILPPNQTKEQSIVPEEGRVLVLGTSRWHQASEENYEQENSRKKFRQ